MITNKIARRRWPILVLGDSLSADGGYWRDYLHDLLLSAGVWASWIGTKRGGRFQGDNHEAVAGKSLATMRADFPALAATYAEAPRVAIVWLGTNDAAGAGAGANAEADLNGLLDDTGCIWSLWPGCSVIIPRITTMWSMVAPNDPVYVAGTAAVRAAQDKIVSERLAAGKNIVEARPDLTITFADTSDGVHPTAVAQLAKSAPSILTALQSLPGGMP